MRLIRLFVVVVLIGLITAMGEPFYSHHVTLAKRLEAENSLITLAERLDEYYDRQNTYQHATLDLLNMPEKIANDRYRLVIAQTSDNDFKVEAVPLGKQAKNDSRCGVLILDSLGKKDISGADDVMDCWD